MPRLKMLSEQFRGKIFDLTKDVHECGRVQDRDIYIPDSTISSHHCNFVRNENGNGYTLLDQGSTNGTRVNNIPVMEQELHHSDILQLGGVEILYENEQETERRISRTQHGITFEQEATLQVQSPADPAISGSSGKGIKIFFIVSGIIVLLLAIYVIYAIMSATK